MATLAVRRRLLSPRTSVRSTCRRRRWRRGPDDLHDMSMNNREDPICRGWEDGRGLEPGYAYGQSGGHIPQSLPRGRFGGGLRQLHLSAAWTSHNTPAFDFAAAHSN